MANPQIVVDFVANTAKLQQATGEVEATGSKFSKWGKGVASAVATGFAVAAVVKFGKESVAAAQESEEATNRLQQIFKSMGDSTGTAAAAAIDYAGKLSRQIGVEDEAIMSAQAMLATFKNVSSTTARQAGIFDRATAAAADLAAAGFGTLDSNAVQLGKALQDPVKGLTALSRAGVTFTAAQKEQIAALVESGQHLEAQKIILQAVEEQVGGTAAATASESDKMKVAFGEVSESVGTMLLPIIAEIAPLLATMADFISKNTKIIVPLGAALLAAAAAMKVLAIAQVALNVAMSANVLGLIVLGIAAVVAAAVLLYKNWDKVTAAVDKGFDVIKSAAQSVFNWVKANWPLLLGILLGPFGLAIGAIIKYWDEITDAARSAVSHVKNVWNTMREFFSGLVSQIGATIQRFAAWFDKPAEAARDMLERIKDAVSAVADFIGDQVGRVSAAIDKVVNAIKKPINAVLQAWNEIGFTLPTVKIPSVSVAGKEIFGGKEIGGWTVSTPDIPLLAAGGVISAPTLALVGEGGGREIVAPEPLLRSIMAENAPVVNVYIGDQELRGIVRYEVVSENTRVARTLLAGRA